MSDVPVRLHPHASARLQERGVTQEEIVETVRLGESFEAKYGRTGFRRDFRFDAVWLGKHYATKQVEAYAVNEAGEWLVISLIARYF